MRSAALTSLAVVLAAAAPAFAQDETARKQAVEIAARVPLEKAATGAPYSADTVVEGFQLLADGNRIVRKTTGKVYRDGEGRVRREDEQPYTMATAGGSTSVVTRTVSIVDPVAGFSYSLDPERKIAWRTPLGVAANIMGKVSDADEMKRKLELAQVMERRKVESEDAPSTMVRARGGEPSSADKVRARGNVAIARTPDVPLEHKVIEGIPVEGHKMSTVIPAGQIGNEQPLTITSEEWRSPELGVLVLTRHSDPRTGDSSYRLTNIVRAEPDRSLFMVPPDYEIRETNVRKMLESSRKD